MHHRHPTGAASDDDQELAGSEGVADALRRFDPRWYPVGLCAVPGRAPDASGSEAPMIARRLDELLECYQRHRGRLHREARALLNTDGPIAEDLVTGAVRRLCHDPPPIRGGGLVVLRAALRAEADARAVHRSTPGPG